jgi:hypothetical protein
MKLLLVLTAFILVGCGSSYIYPITEPTTIVVSPTPVPPSPTPEPSPTACPEPTPSVSPSPVPVAPNDSFGCFWLRSYLEQHHAIRFKRVNDWEIINLCQSLDLDGMGPQPSPLPLSQSSQSED